MRTWKISSTFWTVVLIVALFIGLANPDLGWAQSGLNSLMHSLGDILNGFLNWIATVLQAAGVHGAVPVALVVAFIAVAMLLRSIWRHN